MGNLLFRLSLIIYSAILRSMRVTKLPGQAGAKIKSAASRISARAYAAAAAAFTAFQEEIGAAKKNIADEARVFAAKWGIRKVGVEATESDLYELEQELRREKLGLITAFRAAGSIVVRNGAEKAYQNFDNSVENASLEQVQTIAATYGFTVPQELNQHAKAQLKSAFRASFQKVRGQGEAAMQQAINDAAHKAKVVEQQMLERIQKAKENATENTKLLATGLTVSQIAKLRGRSTAQLQAMLTNLKEGDGRATEWTKAQLESVLKIRAESAARRAKLSAQ